MIQVTDRTPMPKASSSVLWKALRDIIESFNCPVAYSSAAILPVVQWEFQQLTLTSETEPVHLPM